MQKIISRILNNDESLPNSIIIITENSIIIITNMIEIIVSHFIQYVLTVEFMITYFACFLCLQNPLQ